MHSCLYTQTHYTGSSGSVTFVNVPPRDENNRNYILRVVGTTADGERVVIRRAVRVGEFNLYVFGYGVNVEFKFLS